MRDLIIALIMNLGVNPGCTPDVLITLAIAQLYSSDSSAIFKTSSLLLILYDYRVVLHDFV